MPLTKKSHPLNYNAWDLDINKLIKKNVNVSCDMCPRPYDPCFKDPDQSGAQVLYCKRVPGKYTEPHVECNEV
jgi:hypothetical protein